MNLIDVWIALLGLVIILYVILDGFSLGIGIMFPIIKSREERDQMIETIAPVWDANQTWLVFGGGGLFAAFPMMYAILFSALYIPLFTLLYGLIFRGISFEFRANAKQKNGWDQAFFWGSLVAVISQGLTLGGILTGVSVRNGFFSGGPFDWFTPFSIAAAIGLISGYILLASTYLIIKTTGPVQDRSYRQAFWAAQVVFAFQILMILWTPFHYPLALAKWTSAPRMYFIWIFPLLTVISYYVIVTSLRNRREKAPFIASVLFFFSGYLGLFSSLYPDAVPPTVTFYDAAAQYETMRFTLWGAAVTLPIVLAYTIYSYSVFRGKIGERSSYH